MTDFTQQAIDDFFVSLRPVEQGYQHDTFSFVAVKYLENFTLVQGRLFRNADNEPNSAYFETDLVIAGRFTVSELGLSSEELTRRSVLGLIPTPKGELRFPPGDAGRYSAQFEPYHAEGLANQRRLNVLRIDGATADGYVDVAALGWHLRAATEPYHDLNDLLLSFGLGVIREHLNFDVIAFPVTLIDTDSQINGKEARIGVRLADSLEIDKLRIGYRVIHNGSTFVRASVIGTKLSWEQRERFQSGWTTFEVPATAVVECFASFNGIAQHFYYIAEPSSSQNPRRAIFDLFDAKMSLLINFLARQGRGQNARDLEAGVSWLLWLLGFSTAALGGTAKTQDFADVIATTPEGHVVVVECTTGLLKADNKLPLLFQRSQLVRERLHSSNNSHLKVLPVLVTSRTRDEIHADLDQAERLGVLVITKEDLDQAVSRTLTMPNPDILFRQAEEIVRSNIAKNKTEKQLS